MAWYQWLLWISLAWCALSLAWRLARLLRLGADADYSGSTRDLKAAIRYSYTGGMSPAKKESAFLHLPTYTAGMIYHMGTFLSLALVFYLWNGQALPVWVIRLLTIFLLVSAACGIGILVKRMAKKSMRDLSAPDDYLSNILVTLFQALTAAALNNGSYILAWSLSASLLFIYIPLGKLKHLLYFFAARYHLGLFFGRRGVWPPVNPGSDPWQR